MKLLHPLMASLTSTQAHSQFHDAVMLGTVTGATSLSTWVLATVNPWGFDEELKLLLLPLIACMVITTAIILLNDKVETKKIVIGRSGFALFFGSITPQALVVFFPSTSEMINHSSIALMLGGVAAMFFYILSYPFCIRAYKRSGVIADALVRQVEYQFKTDMKESIVELGQENASEIRSATMGAVGDQNAIDNKQLRKDLASDRKKETE